VEFEMDLDRIGGPALAVPRYGLDAVDVFTDDDELVLARHLRKTDHLPRNGVITVENDVDHFLLLMKTR